MSLTNRYKLKVWRNPADKFTPTINEDDISETKLIAYLNILSTNIKAHASEPLVHRIEIQIIQTNAKGGKIMGFFCLLFGHKPPCNTFSRFHSTDNQSSMSLLWKNFGR